MPLIPAFRRLRQEDHEFRTGLYYTARAFQTKRGRGRREEGSKRKEGKQETKKVES
jgi:hypothetical protein